MKRTSGVCLAMLVAACSGKSTVTTKPNQPDPKPVANEPVTKPACTSELNSVLTSDHSVYLILNDGKANRCLAFTANTKALSQQIKFGGNTGWTTTMRMTLGVSHKHNTLTLRWGHQSWTTSHNRCAPSLPNLGIGGGSGGMSGRSGPPPMCGQPLTIDACTGDRLAAKGRTIYLTADACKAALAKGEAPIDLGVCAKNLVGVYERGRKGPKLDKETIAGVAALQAILKTSNRVYWLDPYSGYQCGAWSVSRNANKPNAITLTRTQRRAGKVVTTVHDVSFAGVQLTLSGAAKISGDSCMLVTKAAKRGVVLGYDRGWYTTRAACLRAKKKKKP